MKIVLIAIQARSTSERLPNKSLKLLAGKPGLQYVLEPCQYVSIYMRRDSYKLDADIKTCLVVPKNDPITSIFANFVEVVEGDDHDVLGRYQTACDKYNADYVVRITGDCMQMQTHIIARHIKAALIKDKDYTTNIHYRTYREGWDVEVISKRLLGWLSENAETDADREHVTTLISRGSPFPYLDSDGRPEICHILQTNNESHIKTSIDTKDEWDALERQILQLRQMKSEATRHGIVYV